MSTVRRIAAPNLPIALDKYTQRYQEQLNNILRLFFNSVANEINAPRPHGSFYDTTTQTNPVASTTNLVTYDTKVSAYNVSIGAVSSRIYIAETGVYNIQFSAQLDKTSGASADIYIWLRVNGQNVPYSAGKVVVQGANTELIAAWNYVTTLQANDYFELAWSSSDTSVIILANTSATPAPEIPSIILTVSWVSGVSV